MKCYKCGAPSQHMLEDANGDITPVCFNCYYDPKYEEKLITDRKTQSQLYQELLMAVGRKFPGESRHETALRYIKKSENSVSEQCKTDSIK